MISYLIEAALIHMLLYAGYKLFLSSETQYAWLRSYLVFSVIAALVLPLIQWNIDFNNSVPAVAEGLVLLQSVPIQEVVEQHWLGQLTSRVILFCVFGLVSLIFFLKFLLSLFGIIRSLKESTPEERYGVKVRVLDRSTENFTFFRWIFLTPGPKEAIVLHEKAHADLLHSFDILISHLFRTLFWWLPTAHWSLTQLQLIHEYQADEKVMENTNAEEYKELLINRTLTSLDMELVSPFERGTLLKRLRAIQREKRQVSKVKLLLVGAFALSTILIFSCSQSLDQDIKEISAMATSDKNTPQEVMDELARLKKENPDSKYALLELTGTSSADLAEKMQGMDFQYVKVVSHENVSEHRAYGIVIEGAEKLAVHADDVYEVVDELPQFPGGIQELYKYIAQNLKYPKQARRMGIEGKVYVQFIVDKDGNITEVKAVKGIGAGCDTEAEKVLRTAPKFLPGKVNGAPVKVKMMLPIIYTLQE